MFLNLNLPAPSWSREIFLAIYLGCSVLAALGWSFFFCAVSALVGSATNSLILSGERYHVRTAGERGY